jgi:hypothetical protein
MADRFRITKGWAHRFAAEKISVPMLLRRAGLPANLFEQEKIYVATAGLFPRWRTKSIDTISGAATVIRRRRIEH